MAQFVNVKSSFEEGADVISLPTDNEGCLLINTLNSFGFRGVDGLKYINPANGRTTGIAKNANGTKFSPPALVWGNEEYVVVQRRQSAPFVEEHMRANNGNPHRETAARLVTDELIREIFKELRDVKMDNVVLKTEMENVKQNKMLGIAVVGVLGACVLGLYALFKQN